MGYIIMAYAPEGYQEFVLPNIDNADYAIHLDKRIFRLRENLELPLEIVDGGWSFVRKKGCRLCDQNGNEGFEKKLEDGLILSLEGDGRRGIFLIVLQSRAAFPLFEKYSLDFARQVTVGKEEENDIVYDFRGYISGSHLALIKNQNYWMLQDNSSNGTYLNGRRVSGQEYLNFGDQITLFGLRLIYLESCLALCALSGECKVKEERLSRVQSREQLLLPEREKTEEKKRYFKRAPRTVEALYTDRIEIEAPPQASKQKKRPLFQVIGPSFTMAIPMLLGSLMTILGSRSRGGGGVYMFTGLVTAVTSALLGVFWALINIRSANRDEEENEELRYNAYGQYLINITEFIKEKYDGNREILYRTYLSGQECCRFGREDVRLWNHNERQADFLAVRIGTGMIPFQAEISVPKEKFTLIRDDLAEKPGMIRDSYQWLQSAPVCLNLREKGLIGIVGGAERAGACVTAKNMVAQLAANNCYTDVKLVFIYDRERQDADTWSFARWLPHVWTDDRRTRLIAGSKAEVGDICYELSKVLQLRTEENGQKKEYPLPHFVIFADGMELLQGELLERFIYNPRPEYGITTILLAEKYEDLPNSCENIIQNDGTEARFFHIYNQEEQSHQLTLEAVRDEELEELARRLSHIEVNEAMGSGEIPARLEFLEMYEAETLEQLHVLERWKKNRNYENMRVPVGQKAGGNTCYLDLHEKYHGPHGLVAGTTGSGKSEMLQTYILSLAVNFSPDDAAFFIIDFKGGGMANLFDGLPHMAGQISNLSGNQVQRAMISIKSENLRRQRVFAEHGVNNINTYTRMYKNHEARKPIPHLFIIIDEFAELKREEPEFMKELISVAQVGRSLGVHLILATQKPSGTVDDNIWSNSKFRLCLRVQDRQDSNDMLHKPDAAYITQAGRGFLQVGNDEIYEQFQSAYSGAEYSEELSGKKTAAVMLTLTGREIQPGRIRRKRAAAAKTKSQLDVLIEYLNRLAEENRYEKSGLLMNPPLPQTLYLDELTDMSRGQGQSGAKKTRQNKWTLETRIGLYDDPANQAQQPLCISFAEGGHLAVCGMVATGKSTFLQTLLLGLLTEYSPKELNCYILDYSSRILLPFEKAPHCGGVVVDTDTDKVKKLFYMLDRLMEDRKRKLEGGNYSQYRQAHADAPELPAVLVVIDNCANFREKTGGQFDEQLLRLSREGTGYGIFLALSAAGFGASEIPTRVGDNIRTVLSLEMSDKFKYAEILHTTRVGILPEKDVKGRGLAWVEERLLEFHTALAVRGEDAYEMSSRIEELCLRMAEEWKERPARQIPMIPENPLLREFAETPAYQEAAAEKRWLPLGYRIEDAGVCAVDLWFTYCYMIQGRNRSGKKNVLKLLMYAAAAGPEARLCLIDLNGSSLGKYAEQLSVTCLQSEEAVYEFFKSTVPVFKERNGKKQRLIEADAGEAELAEQMNQELQYFIFISDMSAFIKMAYKQLEGRGSIHAYMENITEKGSMHGFYFFGALNPEDHSGLLGYKLYKNMISDGTGIHLGGNVSGQKLFSFSGIPFQEQGKSMKPGTGLIPAEDGSGQAQKIVLPIVKGNLT